ncbi:MAG TPA: prepilin-type N-terminal cleavage/methylation domain-containing protein [Methylomirabilota bacterium]|nr:prepilin-type N-terminal cleavage/methylation domain-containing protein [Methylomirabilota bacterium]
MDPNSQKGFIQHHFRGLLGKSKSGAGFTLIEAIVATAVFAIVVSSIIGVYLSTFQLDRKTRAQRAVSDNARFIMEFLGKEVRNGTIDYTGANSCVNSDTVLCVVNQALEPEKFSYDGTANLVLTKSPNFSNLNSGGIKITAIHFFVSPAGDPYTAAKTYNEQPYVTVALTLSSNYGNKTGETATLNLESTYVTRSYPSRE